MEKNRDDYDYDFAFIMKMVMVMVRKKIMHEKSSLTKKKLNNVMYN